jgi:hypothetical protein
LVESWVKLKENMLENKSGRQRGKWKEKMRDVLLA